jgi:hypothetical protein
MEIEKSKQKGHKGRLIFWLLVLLAFTVITLKFTDLKQLYLNFLEGDPLFIFLAVFAQFFYFIVFTITYKVSFELVNIKYTFKHLFPLTFVYIFVNVVAPTGGASGPALFATEASHRKESPIRALAGVLIANIAQFLTFSVILFFGAFYLYTMHGLKAYQVVASVLLILLTVCLFALIVLGIYKPSSLRIGLNWSIIRLNKFCRIFRLKKRFSHDWVDDGVKEFALASGNVKKQHKKIKTLFYYYFLVHFINILSLYFLFMAYGQPILFRALVAGFVMGVVFQIVGITPYGIGLTESAMALTFTSLGVPSENAILITLTYRSITFWLPFLIGFILLRKIHIFGIRNVSVIKLFLENKHVENIKKTIKVKLIELNK